MTSDTRQADSPELEIPLDEYRGYRILKGQGRDTGYILTSGRTGISQGVESGRDEWPPQFPGRSRLCKSVTG